MILCSIANCLLVFFFCIIFLVFDLKLANFFYKQLNYLLNTIFFIMIYLKGLLKFFFIFSYQSMVNMYDWTFESVIFFFWLPLYIILFEISIFQKFKTFSFFCINNFFSCIHISSSQLYCLARLLFLVATFIYFLLLLLLLRW